MIESLTNDSQTLIEPLLTHYAKPPTGPVPIARHASISKPKDLLAFRTRRELLAATLTDPQGQRIADFDCSRVSVDRQEIKPTAAQTGWWKLDVHKAQTGMIDDVWVKLESPLSGYFTLDPKRAADIR